MVETGVLGDNPHLTQSHWQLSHMPGLGFEQLASSHERQLAVNGNTLDHIAIRAGPGFLAEILLILTVEKMYLHQT